MIKPFTLDEAKEMYKSHDILKRLALKYYTIEEIIGGQSNNGCKIDGNQDNRYSIISGDVLFQGAFIGGRLIVDSDTKIVGGVYVVDEYDLLRRIDI